MGEEIKEKSTSGQKTALEAATDYLASRMRTEAEIRKRLADKGYGSAETDNAIRELAGSGYIDDYQYALRYYEYNREKKRGSGRAYRELIEKGVARNIAENARADYLYESGADEYEDALEIARRETEDRTDRQDADKLAARIARKLESRGFERSDIFRVLDTIRRELQK